MQLPSNQTTGKETVFINSDCKFKSISATETDLAAASGSNFVSASEVDLAAINRYTRRRLTGDEVYTFSVILCDNEVDRDYERFTVAALHRLGELFLGKTGIFDHNPKGQNQTARIFQTEIVEESRQTPQGEVYTYLKAKAYLIKSTKNADLILEIDGGIKKEVSVGCSVGEITCSVCGANVKQGCVHRKGKQYDGADCHHLLDKPTDAYEWSFVAVPAQRNAGVTKGMKWKPHQEEEGMKNSMRNTEDLMKAFHGCEEELTITKAEAQSLAAKITALKKAAALGESYRTDLIKEVTRLSFLVNEPIDGAVIASVAEKMELAELKAFKEGYEKKLAGFGDNVQLRTNPQVGQVGSMDEFRL